MAVCLDWSLLVHPEEHQTQPPWDWVWSETDLLPAKIGKVLMLACAAPVAEKTGDFEGLLVR